jgi:hypothetical protein
MLPHRLPFFQQRLARESSDIVAVSMANCFAHETGHTIF